MKTYRTRADWLGRLILVVEEAAGGELRRRDARAEDAAFIPSESFVILSADAAAELSRRAARGDKADRRSRLHKAAAEKRRKAKEAADAQIPI